MNKLFNKSFFILTLLLLLQPTFTFAVQVVFDAESGQFDQGQEFLMPIYLNTEGDSVNAVEGKVVFSESLLEVKEIREGNSSINFWIEKPTLSSGAIVFSGITPGGFQGPKQLLFVVVFEAKQEGIGEVSLETLKALRNDGNGTESRITSSRFAFSVSNMVLNSTIQTPTDAEPPEDFKPAVGSDQALFDGKQFLVFSTVDKGVGIDHYEIREGFFGSFVKAESPYLLASQTLGKKIYVKVVDKAGNEKVVTFESERYHMLYKLYIFLAIILSAGFGLLLNALWQKFIKSLFASS